MEIGKSIFQDLFNEFGHIIFFVFFFCGGNCLAIYAGPKWSCLLGPMEIQGNYVNKFY